MVCSDSALISADRRFIGRQLRVIGIPERIPLFTSLIEFNMGPTLNKLFVDRHLQMKEMCRIRIEIVGKGIGIKKRTVTFFDELEKITGGHETANQ